MTSPSGDITNMDRFMEDALSVARTANELNEVPVGCVFVHNEMIIASACNRVNASKNATRHAEFECVDQTLAYCASHSLNINEIASELSVFVTCEPCIMCAAALKTLRVKEIVYGCRNDRFGGETVLNVGKLLAGNYTIRGGVRADEAMELLKTFYKGVNPSAPKPYIRKKFHADEQQQDQQQNELNSCSDQ